MRKSSIRKKNNAQDEDVNDMLKNGNVKSIDIMQLDHLIRQYIDKENGKLQYYKDCFDAINIIGKDMESKSKELDIEKNTLQLKIQAIESFSLEADYIGSTYKILQEYTEILKIPIVKSFLSKTTKQNLYVTQEIEFKKNNLKSDFLQIAQLFIPMNLYYDSNNYTTVDNSCLGCGNTTNFERNSSCLVCIQCGMEKQFHSFECKYNSMNDNSRINIHTKYKYERKSHFRDSYKQYQGKQNRKIDKKVFDALERQFDIHNLLVNTSEETPFDTSKIAFYNKHVNITKEHLFMFLRETGFSKHYEDVNLIYSYFTGIPCPDISHLKKQLFCDFDQIDFYIDSILEEDQDISRSSFLNGQYILYQLLIKNKHKCNENDFSILKSRDRLIDHDDKYSKICLLLNWNFVRLAG